MIQSKTQVNIWTIVSSVQRLKCIKIILNANIRGMVTNFDKLKLLIDDLDYTFPIIGITETWMRTHNADCFFNEWIFA